MVELGGNDSNSSIHKTTCTAAGSRNMGSNSRGSGWIAWPSNCADIGASCTEVLSPTIMEIINDIHTQFTASCEAAMGEKLHEVMIKTTQVGYVVGRKAFGREVFLILDKNVKPEAVSEAAEKLCKTFFRTILL